MAHATNNSHDSTTIPTKHIKHLAALHHLCVGSPSGFQVSIFPTANLDCHAGKKFVVIQRNANPDLLTAIILQSRP